jgi:hypothetical protein
LLGTVSITDDSSISNQDEFPDLIQRYLAEGGQDASVEVSGEQGRQVLKIGDKTIATFALDTGTVEQSIDGVTMLYSLLKKRGLPAQQFIEDYTRRPVATLPEILGNSLLKFDENGDVEDPETMIEGFHSRAFGDYNTNVRFPAEAGVNTESIAAAEDAFFALLTDAQSDNFRKTVVNKGAKPLPPIPKYLDPRGRSWQRVNAYMEELRLSRGLAGE